jgi:hypothetical protein
VNWKDGLADAFNISSIIAIVKENFGMPGNFCGGLRDETSGKCGGWVGEKEIASPVG